MKTCYFCQGKVINKRIRHVHHLGDEIVIFENVPAEVCTQCGETYFSPEVLGMMDKATLERTPPDKSIAVPVFSLP
ncbi:MAG: YgiT-type zinc finger protein [Chloroflexi bacterium]|nr:YgiT-type zinc finger protein [Chloroflexota bacterium]